MTNEGLMHYLQEQEMTEIMELIEDARNGELEELELIESIGLVYDKKLNGQVLKLLQDYGVKIVYVKDDDE